MKRAIVILLDGVGCGELPDAFKYNDKGSNTLANLAREVGGLKLPQFERLGLGNIIKIRGVSPTKLSTACYGKAAQLSAGKDSISGHWELMGVIIHNSFPVYPQGFPVAMLEKFEKAIERPIIGGWTASGTEIIKKFGKKHIKTGYPIVYTSADSVFQIAAHKDVIPLLDLYKFCKIARKLFPEIGRIIARPFTGKLGAFKRTSERKDYSVLPPGLTLFDLLKKGGLSITTIGKVDYLFDKKGISQIIHTKDNKQGMERTIKIMRKIKEGLIFTNLADFDILWGHRNNKKEFAKGLKEVDRWLPILLRSLKSDDILFITADHGNDPTTPSTDHSREYIPILVYGKKIKKAVNLGTRKSFSDLGATIGEYFNIKMKTGISFLSDILNY